jgi:filamentous hemagglutinin family protein
MKRVLFGAVAVWIGVIAIGDRAMAQVVPDNTLGTQVTQTGVVFGISNGTRSGNNLFHSFSQFSVPSNGSAIFNNAMDVQNIFGRVTGSQLSNIDGILKTQGTANLFLMNPNGIIFGPNAQLQLGGSFLGTTATGIKFADGIEFNTVNETPALLSVNLPIGLQMGQNLGNIQVQGRGHQLTGGAFTPAIRDNTQSALAVNSGKTIALIGQNITLSGGVLTAENGRIELGAVQSGTVDIDHTVSDLQFDYANIQNFGDIQFSNNSLVDASGLTSRGIQLQGDNISLKDGSVALIQTMGSQAPKSIRVRATGSLEVSGDVRTAPDLGVVTGVISSRLMTENLGIGKGADIDIAAGDLRLNDGGAFLAKTHGLDSGGNINVNIVRDIQINRISRLNPVLASGVATATYSSAQSGNMKITASNLTMTDGSLINAVNFGQGNSGNVNLNVSGTIEMKGVDSSSLGYTAITNIGSTAFSNGNGGSLTLNTSRLIVGNNTSVNTETLNSGAGGKITINASESVEVRGGGLNDKQSSITASASIPSTTFRLIFGLPARPSGNAGSSTINTPKLQIDNGAIVSVNNEGLGNAGILTINANSLRLHNKGQIIANTASGEGGNIILNLQSDLVLRNNSLISTEAKGDGNGGNIILNSPSIVGLENSDIIANAVGGRGGNINITTQGIIGLKFRNTLTPRTDLTNDITDSSEFSLNGNVQVNTIGINPTNALNTLPVDVVDSSRQIADRCGNAKGSSFVATGRGGIPQGPKKHGSDRPWNDLRTNSRQASANVTSITQNIQPIVEASAIEVDESGAIALVAPHSISAPTAATCGMAGSIGAR